MNESKLDTGLDFSEALRFVKNGKKVFRQGWNGKGMYIAFQKGYPEGVLANKNSQEAYGVPEGTIIKILPYLAMRTADGSFVPWLASQTDILADDWCVKE